MPVKVVVEGLDEIRARMAAFPQKYKDMIKTAMYSSLVIFHENVPSYPYGPWKRTGTLGRSLGVNQQGGKIGQPDIYEVKMGSGMSEASFGTKIEYAPRVIGEGEQEKPWSEYWWTIKTIADKAKDKITKVFQLAVDKMARWLDHSG